MKNFRDVVTDFSIGALSKSKVGFYAKRLAKETATRRLASALMIGLLVFQFVTFIAPPKSSQASGSDLIPGGFANVQDLLNKYDANVGRSDGLGNGIHSIMDVFGIQRADIEHASNPNGSDANWYCNSGLLSMGYGGPGNAVAGATVGPCGQRWAQGAITGVRFNNADGSAKKYFIDLGYGAQWYEIGTLYNCANLVFFPTPPPPPPPVAVPSVSCYALNYTVPTTVAGNDIGFRGYAHGENVGGGDLVDMEYQRTDANDVPIDTQWARGIPPDGNNMYIDGTIRIFNYPDPGAYKMRLWIHHNNAIAPNSAQGACIQTVTITPKSVPRALYCAQLNIANSGTKIFQSPYTPFLQGEARQVGDSGPVVYAKTFTYLLAYEVPAGTAGPVINYQGKYYLEGNPNPAGKSRIVHTSTNQTANGGGLFTDPTSGAGFDAADFAQIKAGNLLLILRVTDQNGVTAPENSDNCYVPFTVTPQPKDYRCVSLTAQPTTGNAPLNVDMTATSSVLNTKIKQYDFDFGDGNKLTVPSDKLTTSVKHTYASGGKKTATVTVVPIESMDSKGGAMCKIDINVEQQNFKKTVSNATLLTSDNKPTDANNQAAKAGDKLTYQIGILNQGSTAVKDFVFEDDITYMLEYADLVDAGGAQLVKTGPLSKLVWPAMTIAVANPNNPTYIVKTFTIQVKSPLPTNAKSSTDASSYNCSIKNEFRGSIVITPLSVNPAKKLECTFIPPELPQTGPGIAIAFIALFAASSLFLFFRNRLLKRELQLVETLNEGAPTNG